ncbi:MAG: winged helix-turn-helix domain-containing protein [Xanthomonadales bacterium]|nr:winged helix-turn-helix domain-containing protein [Xanthomonadales bacterium]
MRYDFVDLTIDLGTRQVLRGEQLLDIQGLSFDLLAWLLQQPQRVVTPTELIEAVWAPAVVNDETVTQRVKLLRQALGDDSRQPRYLRTVRGRGYQLCAAATVIAATRESPVPRTAHRRPRAWPAWLGAAVLALAVMAWFTLRTPVESVDSLGHGQAAPDGFSALMERAHHYASIGQRDDTLRAIDLFRQSLALQPTSTDARLGLSFTSSAMMCAHNDGATRAEEAERLASAVLADEPDNARAFAARAYAADCRGLIEAAMADYARAIALDPVGRLDSLASLAHLQAIRGELALALAGNLRARASGHDLRLVDLQLSHNLELLGYPAAAERLLQRSYQLHPDSAFIAAAWPAFLFRQGRIEQARATLTQSVQRPQHPSLWLFAGELALLDGDRAAAAAAFARAESLKPGSGPAPSLRRIYAGSLDRDWATQRLQQLHEATAAGDRWPDNWLEIAQLQLALGQPAEALAALDQARQAGYRDRLALTQSPLWQDLRQQPGYTELLERIATAIATERERAREVPGLAELLAEGVH